MTVAPVATESVVRVVSTLTRNASIDWYAVRRMSTLTSRVCSGLIGSLGQFELIAVQRRRLVTCEVGQ